MLVKIWPADVAEFALAVGRLVEDHRPGDVRGHQVRRELDALEVHVQNLGDARDHERLGEAGDADEQAVAAGEDRGEDLLDHVVLADEDAAELVGHLRAGGAELAEVVGNFISRHARLRGNRRPDRVGPAGVVVF